MKSINKKHLNFSDEELFQMSLRSTSGCNIKVGDKHYNAYKNSKGETHLDEFIVEFELTKDEFKLLKYGYIL